MVDGLYLVANDRWWTQWCGKVAYAIRWNAGCCCSSAITYRCRGARILSPGCRVDTIDSCDSKGLKTIAPEGPSFNLLFGGFDLEGLKRFDAHPTDRLTVGRISITGRVSGLVFDASGTGVVMVVGRVTKLGLGDATKLLDVPSPLRISL